jgi:DNA-binding LacI/PurR family transcriptional regulator
MPSRSRPVVGLLTSSTVEPWAVRQWEGIVGAARDLNVELVSYIGGVLRSAQFEGQAGVMYDLAAAGRLDGLIIWTTALGWMLPRRNIVELLDRFGSTPKVSMEMSFPGIPSVVMDDYSGMRAVVDHLIEDHGRRRIAFLRGPSTHEGFERRFRAYRDSLEGHGLPVDAGLISPPFPRIDGAVSMRAIVGEGRPAMDAVVGADDLFAISALTVLAERGVRVPEDVAVAGFDNMPEDLAASPPITSADAPFAAMGRRAMEILADLMAGRSAPDIETVPVGLVRRRSCGCQSSREPDERGAASKIGLHRAAAMPPEGSFDAEEGWKAVAEALREAAPDPDEATVRALWEKFAVEARGGEQGPFIEAFRRELEKAAETRADPTRWLRLLVAIQRATSPWTSALP